MSSNLYTGKPSVSVQEINPKAYFLYKSDRAGTWIPVLWSYESTITTHLHGQTVIPMTIYKKKSDDKLTTEFTIILRLSYKILSYKLW